MTRRAPRSRRDFCLDLNEIMQHVAEAPDGLDVVLTVRGVGELLAQLADEDVDAIRKRAEDPTSRPGSVREG
jgi:hypothetical protein